MRRPKAAPTITYVHSNEPADLSWVTAMLVRWTLERTPMPPEDCRQPATTGTHGQAPDGTPLQRRKSPRTRTTS
jgi:hypothetical protein